MDHIILGILMLRRLTLYGIQGIIKQNLKSVCSDSRGSIQAGIKKLLEGGFITCNEYVENSVNKKEYAITDSGRAKLVDWIRIPADMTKAKNMDTFKLLMMGIVPKNERIGLIKETVQKLRLELLYLEEVKKKATENVEGREYIENLIKDHEYSLGIQNATKSSNLMESMNEIEFFEKITLQYGIDYMQFQLNWFESLLSKLKIKEEQE